MQQPAFQVGPPMSSEDEKSDESDFSSSPLNEASFHTPARPAYLPSSTTSSASSASSSSGDHSRASFRSTLYPQSFAGPSPTPYAFASFARSSDAFAGGNGLAAGNRFAPPAAPLTESALRMHTGQLSRRSHGDHDSCTSSCSHSSRHSHASRSCSCTGTPPPPTPPRSDDNYSICSCSLATESDSEFGSDCSDCSEGELEANLVIAHELTVSIPHLLGYVGGNPITLLSGVVAGLVTRIPEYLGWVTRKLPKIPRWEIHPSAKAKMKQVAQLDGETSHRVTAIVLPPE